MQYPVASSPEAMDLRTLSSARISVLFAFGQAGTY